MKIYICSLLSKKNFRFLNSHLKSLNGLKIPNNIKLKIIFVTSPKILFDIPNTVFTPRPKVVSSLVEFMPLKKPLYKFTVKNIEKITHITFSKRQN